MWDPTRVGGWPVAHAHGSRSPAVDAKASNCHCHNHPFTGRSRLLSVKQLAAGPTARISGDYFAKSKEPHNASPEPWRDRQASSHSLVLLCVNRQRKLNLLTTIYLLFGFLAVTPQAR
jgi:hypothetical protein